MNSQEIRAIITNLEKAREASNSSELKTLLRELEANVEATEGLLRETKVGVHVNKLKTFSDPEVVALVKKTIKKWKDQVTAEKKKKRPVQLVSNKETETANKVTDVKFKEQATSAAKKGPRTPTTDGIKVEVYSDLTRNRSIIALYTAVALETSVAATSILDTCTKIELAIYNANKESINDTYRNKLRSLILNIKNKNNPQLRENILDGKITAEKLIKMTSQELAPESLKKEMKELHAKNLFDAQGAVEKRAVTDRFVCGKCKQREVSYYQMQTRSADEPLTTFCTCEKCGNRWKFC